MKKVIVLLIVFFCSGNLFSQQDSVFIKHSKDWTADTLTYVTDTVLFNSGMTRNLLIGTAIMPWTRNQMDALGFGLYFNSVSKSDCKNSGSMAYMSVDRINSIDITDSSLIVDINIYDNCCYDFLCDISVDSLGVLNLIYYGYGTNCACNCCFGLIYNFEIVKDPDYGKITAVMINNDKRTLKRIKKHDAQQ